MINGIEPENTLNKILKRHKKLESKIIEIVEKKRSFNNERLFDIQLNKYGGTSLSSGWPDKLVFIKDKVFAVEIKNSGEKIRSNQVRMLEALRGLGIKCFVYRGEKHFWRDIIRELSVETK